MRTRCLTVFLLLIALVCTGLCDELGFVSPPRHSSLRNVEEKVGNDMVSQQEVISEATAESKPATKEPSAATKASLPKTKKSTTKKAKKDSHIKIIVHSTNNCPYCVQLMNTLKAFEDKYEIVEEKHDRGFRPDYSYYYVTSFPYVEYLYDGKVKLYHYGLRTEDQVKRFIEQISR